MVKRRERSEHVTAQLALPGIETRPASPVFDPFEMIRDTFRQLAPEGVMPAIEISRRMLRTLGSFTPARNVIRLSSRLLTLGTPAEQKRVALHEVAHAIVHQRAPQASAHGREFRAVCRELGLDAGRFVSIDHAAWREQTRFAVQCPSCGDQILRRKRARRVRCECGTALRPRSWASVAVTSGGVKPL